MAQDYSQQFSMFAGDPYGAAMDQMNYAPNYAIQPGVGLNLNDLTGILQNVPINVNPQLTEEELLQRFLETEGGDVETNPFVQQNIFQRGLDFLRDTPSARVGLGAILGGPVGALTGFFANKIGGGITNLIDRFRNRGRDVEINLPQVIQTGSDFVDEFSRNDPGTVGGSSFDTATGGTFGSSVDDASTFSDYS
tara:strand:+ start:82 stop:663 length:582 start_codon:yes stop_codon:yes gene_type:complete